MWLSGNDFQFNRKKDVKNTLEELIKYRAFQWGVAANFLRNDLEVLWKVNSIGATLLSNKKESQEGIVLWNTDAVGYVYGSWNKEIGSDGLLKISAGVGGYLIDYNIMGKFMFPGPTKAWCPLEAKKKTVIFLYKKAKFFYYGKGRITICTDSMIRMQQYQKEMLGLDNENNDPFWYSLLLDKKFNLKYLPREKLQGADNIAKDGRRSTNMITSWC